VDEHIILTILCILTEEIRTHREDPAAPRC